MPEGRNKSFVFILLTYNKSRPKSSQPHPEKRAIAEHFCFTNTLSLIITNSDFCLSFYASEALMKVRHATNLKSG